MKKNSTTKSLASSPRQAAVPDGLAAGPALRAVTAAALFDGHDASINLVRRLLQSEGAEVIHLGHNRAARQIASAAVQEDAQAVLVSSYQGGHLEFFPYLRQLLDSAGRKDARIFAGGGGVILPGEIEELEKKSVSRIFTPEDGRRLGLGGMAKAVFSEAGQSLLDLPLPPGVLEVGNDVLTARAITAIEMGQPLDLPLRRGSEESRAWVVGITGTGGSGKSSLVDELVLRFGRDFPGLPIAILANDPTKRKTGGALLGDRLRMNAIDRPGVYLRSLATRGSGSEMSESLSGAIQVLRQTGYPLILVETSGIGQSGAGVLPLAQLTLYVMTSDFGGPTQLEKIEMLDSADLIAINKADRPGAEDARREVARQVKRGRPNHVEEVVFTTAASRFADPGVECLYRALLGRLEGLPGISSRPVSRNDPAPGPRREPRRDRIIPLGRQGYLAEVAATVRDYHRRSSAQVEAVRKRDAAARTLRELEVSDASSGAQEEVAAMVGRLEDEIDENSERLLSRWEEIQTARKSGILRYRVRDQEMEVDLRWKSLSDLSLPRIAFPPDGERGEILRFLYRENLPGSFPFTAGAFPVRKDEETPTRMFAGEGPPERTNRRFHLLSRGEPSRRLSTAFDSVTLYGEDPDERPDIYGKIGESGVSVATLRDMKRLFEGFELCDPNTSVSMTINGPAPTILAMYFNAAIDQQVDRFEVEQGRPPDDGERASLRDRTLRTLRGTVQADILKEDQAQNTCIFSTEFALKMMGDVQQFFVENGVRNYYSVSVSGYHIAEAGANPITQLAFTLANGFTYLEYYLGRGMALDQFAPNFSFFFSNGLDAEYSVLGRVARRIWAVALRDRYGGNERSQKLKYHIQTSGRSLHAREISFNDIRTTLQALFAHFDQCNSLHTNAYDEAITTPTEESVRRALAIQLIVSRELGLARVENPLQGSFLMDELTDLVEEAVLCEFEMIAERGGVLGAMETGYIRSRIQEESLLYEEKKHSGEIPIIGVNTFLGPEEREPEKVSAVRATRVEKDLQIRRLRQFQEENREGARIALGRLKEVVRAGGNTFQELMEAVRHASLGQISHALYTVGGAYRRAM